MKKLSLSVEETTKTGENLGKHLTGGEFIILIGDLGGGKTQFTKGVARGLGIKEMVISPTFVLERIYQSPKNLVLHHLDFYRLGGTESELESGVADVQKDKNAIVVIEWAKNISKIVPNEYLEINFKYLDDNKRELVFVGHGKKYQQLIERLK